MPNESEETTTPETNESDVVEPESTEGSAEEHSDADERLKSALVQKDKFREKYEKAEAERKALEERLNKANKAPTEGASPVLDVDDYIDISTSLDGLDARQKAYLAEQHKMSGKPMKDIRASEDFQLWNEAYTARLEKEAALKPSSTQEQEDVKKSFTDRLKGATLAEKEAMLAEAGLLKVRKTQPEQRNIGDKRSLY